MNSEIGQEFMEKTKYEYLEASDQEKGLPQPPLELGPPMDAGETIDLPAPASLKLGGVPLRDVIETRQSLRTYSAQSLTLKELSYLLWCTQGVRKVVPGRTTFRTIPSAGARHPLETFLLVNRVKGLKSGLYRFLACDHRLVKLASKPDIAKQMVEACGGQEFVAASAVTFIWTAVPYRTTWRYGERGYRYMHLDAGHVCQNLYLATEAIEAGACAIGAFLDDAMNELLGLDGVKQFVIYLAAVGKRK
ncbi:TPA: nitroreductase [Candidatus Acetothermia bacterium]|nr:nitroreductase [Candidatus Acetothermia bacterium]